MLRKLLKSILLNLHNFRDKLLQVLKSFTAKNRNMRICIIAASIIFIVSIFGILLHYINKNHNVTLNKKIIQKYKHHSSNLQNSHYPAHMLSDFYKLYDTNHDIRGWLSIPNTVINYPVVQSTDNDYYLHNNFNKSADYYGSLFLDYRNNISPQSQNMIIYGHNMKDGQMLTAIVNYEQTDFYKTSSLITFNTIYGHYSWKVFAAFITNADPKDGYVFNYLVTNFSSNDAFNNFIKEVRERSLINTPSVDVVPGDTLLTLSTCYYSSNDARFVVMARRVRPNESTSIEPATRNENALSATEVVHN